MTSRPGDAREPDSASIEMLSVDDGTRAVLVRGGTYGRYVSDGLLTYVNQGTLYAVQMNMNRRAVEGAPVPLMSDLSYSRTFGYAQMDVSRTGTLVYRKGTDSGPFVVQWVDRGGRTNPLLSEPGRYNWPRLSPDGRRLAFSATDSGATNIWIHDAHGGDRMRLTTSGTDHSGLMWSADGGFLVFGGVGGLASIPSDDLKPSTQLTTNQAIQVPWSLSPDGKRLAYAEMSLGTAFDLWTVPVALIDNHLELGTPEAFLKTPAMETSPSFSPDGNWMAYVSNDTGAQEVYVRRFPDDGTKVRVSDSGGTAPHWSFEACEKNGFHKTTIPMPAR